MSKSILVCINIVCLILIAYFSILSWRNLTASSTMLNNDYALFYKTLRDPSVMYRTLHHLTVINKTLTDQSIFNFNTPTMNLFLKPMINFSDDLSTNVLLWVLLSLFGASVSVILLTNWLNDYHIKYLVFLPALVALETSRPALFNANSGQLAFFLLPILCAAFFLESIKKRNAAAVLFGLLASLKLFFLIFLLFYVTRQQWRLLLIFLVSFIGFFFLPIVFFTKANYWTFFHANENSLQTIYRSLSPLNGALLGFVAKMFGFFKTHPTVIEILIPTYFLSIYIIVRWMIYDYRKLKYLPEFSTELAICFLIVFALMCSPSAWLYYHVFLLIPVLVLIKMSRHYLISNRCIFYFAIALFSPYFLSLPVTGFFSNAVYHVCVFFSLVFWMLCLLSASSSIQHVETAKKYQSHILLFVIVLYTGCSFLFLDYHNAVSRFIEINKPAYLKNITPGVWIQKE